MTVEKRPWDETFRRSLEAAKAHGTDVNDELEKEWFGGVEWFERYIKPLFPDSQDVAVCEIGPGTGRIARWAIKHTSKMYLADYSDYACALLRQQFPKAIVIHTSDCKLDGIPDESLDVVYSVGVFAHLFEEQAYRFISQGFQKLKAGGVISVHCIDVRGDMELFLKHMPDKIDSQRTIFRFLHPDYAKLFAEHAGFSEISILPLFERHYFMRARKPS